MTILLNKALEKIHLRESAWLDLVPESVAVLFCFVFFFIFRIGRTKIYNFLPQMHSIIPQYKNVNQKVKKSFKCLWEARIK